MAMTAIHTTLLLLYIGISTGPGALAEHTACSQTNRTANLQACLSTIVQHAVDTRRFWFGSSGLDRCLPQKANSIDCYNPHSSKNFSLSELTFGLPNANLWGVNRYIDIKYTSKPGSYMACDYVYNQTESQTYTIDPLSSTDIAPWHLRDLPEVTWDDPTNDTFTLVIMDPGFDRLRGLYVNIPGSDISKSDVIQKYTAPLNPRSAPTPLSFVLYKQSSTLNVNAPPTTEGFKVDQFAQSNQLQGPVGLTWVLAGYDAYSVANNEELPDFQNCASLVQDALLNDHKRRPFLPERPDLSVNMRLQIDTNVFSYPCGSNGTYTRPAHSFYADPIGKPLVHTADARNDVNQTYRLQMNKVNPDNVVDFKGKLYSLVIVDPDIPLDRSSLGGNARPLLHGLSINIKVICAGTCAVGPFSMVSTNLKDDDVASGQVIKSYIGPGPPDNKTHFYYFLLYEQKNLLNLTDTTDFSQMPCPASLLGRCLFNVTLFASTYDMDLVGMTWLTSTTDEYIVCRRNPPEASTSSPEDNTVSSSPLLSFVCGWRCMVIVITLVYSTFIK